MKKMLLLIKVIGTIIASAILVISLTVAMLTLNCIDKRSAARFKAFLDKENLKGVE